jgi:basic amino acid/polyamine antiporter, APA family
MEPTTPESPKGTKKLNLLDATMLIMGSMIGSGIFIVSADISRQVSSPGLLLLVWVVSGLMTVTGALSYGELAAAMPHAGGPYVYLKRIYGPLWGYLYGFTLFAVIQTGTIAAVGVAFAKFSGVFFAGISPDVLLVQLGVFSISTQQALGIAVVLLLTGLNFFPVKTGAAVQNLFTFAKIGALAVVILFGLWAGLNGQGDAANFAPLWPEEMNLGMVGIFFAALTGALFSSDAWNNVSYAAGEVERPQRTLPIALIIGTGTVCGLYILTNVIYLYILPITDIATAPLDRVATLLLSRLLGNSGQYVMAGLIMVSTFGCLNGVILSGGRVYYAMAKDGYFIAPAGRENRYGVPAVSLALQAGMATLLTLSGSYGQLLDYVMFAVIFFYILTIGGIFVLRIREPNMERPYRAWGYPWVPALYLLLSTAFILSLLIGRPEFALRGLGIVAIGAALYPFARKEAARIKALKKEE